MGLMQLARTPTASFCHFANTGSKKSGAQKRRERHKKDIWGEEGWERGGGSEGLRKGEGMQRRELVKAKKREKGQDIGGGKERGRILKGVKRAEAKKRENKAAGDEKKEQKCLQ